MVDYSPRMYPATYQTVLDFSGGSSKGLALEMRRLTGLPLVEQGDEWFLALPGGKTALGVRGIEPLSLEANVADTSGRGSDRARSLAKRILNTMKVPTTGRKLRDAQEVPL